MEAREEHVPLQQDANLSRREAKREAGVRRAPTQKQAPCSEQPDNVQAVSSALLEVGLCGTGSPSVGEPPAFGV